jgi:hypothetical protein
MPVTVGHEPPHDHDPGRAVVVVPGPAQPNHAKLAS